MAKDSILGGSKLIAFVSTTDRVKARAFYECVLGLPVVVDDPRFSVVFDANGTSLRVTTVAEHHPAPFTVLGWQVDSIEDTAARLSAAGVEFLRYPGMNDSDPLGIWTSPAGARVAWFHDPDNNVLSLTEFPQPTV